MAELPNYQSGKRPRLNYYSEDPHTTARIKSRKTGQPGLFEQMAKAFSLSLPGRPTVTRHKYGLINALGYEKSILIPDLNKYNAGVNLKAMHDEMGIEHIILRMGGPRQFVADNFLLTEDPTWRTYYQQAVNLGFKSIGGYFVYSAGIDAQDYVNGHILFDAIREWTSGGFVPDYFIGDDEVNTWIEHGTTVYATPPNQVKGIMNLYPKLWDKFRKPGMEYTARWFINQTIPNGESYSVAYSTWLDNVNKGYDNQGALGKIVLNWWAWYIGEFNGKSTIYNDEATVLNAIPLPTSAQQNNYLNLGSRSLYDLHQFTATMLTPYNKNAAGQISGLDWNVSRQSESEFLALINKVVTPPPPPPPPPPGGDDLTKRVEALETGYSKLDAWAKSFPAYAG